MIVVSLLVVENEGERSLNGLTHWVLIQFVLGLLKVNSKYWRELTDCVSAFSAVRRVVNKDSHVPEISGRANRRCGGRRSVVEADVSSFLPFPVGWLLVECFWGNYNHKPTWAILFMQAHEQDQEFWAPHRQERKWNTTCWTKLSQCNSNFCLLTLLGM